MYENNTIKDFSVGNRVEAHPTTDSWKRGDRLGTVTKVGRKLITVTMDSGKVVQFSPTLLTWK